LAERGRLVWTIIASLGAYAVNGALFDVGSM
jgi:hypothetical protein